MALVSVWGFRVVLQDLCSWENGESHGDVQRYFDGGKLAPVRATKLLHFL